MTSMPKADSAPIVEASHPALLSIQAPEGRPSDSRDEGGLVALPHDMPKVPGVAYRPRLVSFEFAEDLQVRLSNEPEGRTLVLTGRERVQIKARDATEERLLAIWRNLLRTDAIGVEDSFFDVGGNSLSTVNLKRRERKTIRQTSAALDASDGAHGCSTSAPAARFPGRSAPYGRDFARGRKAAADLFCP